MTSEQITTTAPEIPQPGQWVRVTTDWTSSKSGYSAAARQKHTHVGLVTYASEDGLGFEMTTGESGSFILREVLMDRVAEIEVLPGGYAPGLHQRGIGEAATREKDAERKKVTRQKREGMFR
jgi:hypothetical protein|nr:hypothetical protein [Neorhizobium tomejilense]